MIYLTRLKPQTIVFYHVLPPQRPLHDALRVRGHQFQLPNCIYKFHKRSFIVSSIFRFLKYFFLDCFSLFYLLCAAVNFYFIIYNNLLLCFIQPEMHVPVRLICAIKFYLLTYFHRATHAAYCSNTATVSGGISNESVPEIKLKWQNKIVS